MNGLLWLRANYWLSLVMLGLSFYVDSLLGIVLNAGFAGYWEWSIRKWHAKSSDSTPDR
jgi:hypothetical protein